MALWALPHCWAHLVGVSGRKKIYSWSIIIIKIYPALSAAVGGQDGMDCSRRLWMTCSIYGTCHQSQCLVLVLIVGNVGPFFFLDIYTYMSSYNITIPILPFTMP
jgi:nitrate reductase NapE component